MTRLGGAILFVSVFAGCRERPSAATSPPVRGPAADVTPAPAEATDASAGPGWALRVDPASRARIDMAGIKEHITGDATHADGTLEVKPHDLTRTRGNVRFDLATFETHTFGNDQDATQTRHARTWLEVQVGDVQRDDMRWAEFDIEAVEAPSARDLGEVIPRREGNDDVRTVTMTVRGELSIHGHRVSKDDVVEAAFHHPAGMSVDAVAPTSVRIVSKQPMRVVLKDHDIKPRDPAGQLLQWTTQLVSKVAETADVTVELNATPLP